MVDTPSSKALLVLDRDLLTCQAISRALEAEADFRILDTATTVEEARDKIRRHPVEFVVASAHLPADDLLSLSRWMREDGQDPPPRLIVTGMKKDEAFILRYLENGVSGYTLGEFSVEGLAMVLRLLDRGEAVISPRLAYLLMHRIGELAEAARERGLQPANLEELTRREREVLELVAQELTNREIADRLYVSVGTVKSHVHKILRKLSVRSRDEAARLLKLQEATRSTGKVGTSPGVLSGASTGRGRRS